MKVLCLINDVSLCYGKKGRKNKRLTSVYKLFLITYVTHFFRKIFMILLTTSSFVKISDLTKCLFRQKCQLKNKLSDKRVSDMFQKLYLQFIINENNNIKNVSLFYILSSILEQYFCIHCVAATRQRFR